ncbi:MAG: 4'-phosphopantetheinyl transferase superfamily protein, partial [Pseudomonadota bacterium]
PDEASDSTRSAVDHSGAIVDVILWSLVEVEATDEVLAPFAKCLSSEEQDRAARFSTLALKRDFVVARCGLRLLLAEATGLPARKITFDYGKHGKPLLAPDGRVDPFDLSFNLSHSKGIAALAIGRSGLVGVDIEAHRSVKLELAKRYFASAEYDALSRLDRCDQERLFFDLWVAKEACLKASGLGVSGGLDAFSFDASSSGALARDLYPKSVHPLCGEPASWRLRLFDPVALAPLGQVAMSGAIAVQTDIPNAALNPRFRAVGFAW